MSGYGPANLTRLIRVPALAGSLLGCGAPEAEVIVEKTRAEVRNGSPSLACEWPAVVALDLGCSATLVHPEVVVYAAHCGTGVRNVSFGEEVDRPRRVAKTRHCTAHPRAALGNGFDVAFCLLDEPVADVPVIPIAAGCELDGVRAGVSSTLVGFGVEHDGGAFGVKRSAPIVLGATGPDLVIEAAPAGSCAGDSGGPLLIEVPSVLDAQPRLIGVLSAASAATCQPSTEHYSYLPPLLAWLESESSRDLTPCFESDGSWSPKPKCVAARSTSASWESGCSSPSDTPERLATCGPPFDPTLLLDGTPPELDVVAPANPTTELIAEGKAARTSAEAVAFDAKSGVAEVRFELHDARGLLRAVQRDEVPPYQLEPLRLPRGTWSLDITARDHASNERRAARTFVVDGASQASTVEGLDCTVRARPMRNGAKPWFSAIALVAYCLWSRVRTRRHERADAGSE
jgi:hypothetical protein